MKSRIRRVWTFGLITFCLGSFGALASESGPIPIPAAARPSAHFDPESATNAYLALKNISCEFRDGVLTLRGSLPSYYLKQVAQEAVVATEGVERVENHIEVASSICRR